MPPAIVTVTPNGSVDLVFRRLGPSTHEEQAVDLVAETAGGKGHNVARFLAAAGHPVTACGLAGGWTGTALGALLVESGVSPRLTRIAGQTRRYISFIGAGRARLSYRAAGPEVGAEEVIRLVEEVEAAADTATMVILAGSLPPGAPADLLETIARVVGPTRVVLDSSGAALTAGIRARPAMVKVNRDELRIFGEPPNATLDPAGWDPFLERLAAQTGIATWWVTLGAVGAVGRVNGRTIGVAAPAIAAVNTTGAGDAFLAGLLDARLNGVSPDREAAVGVAWASAVCEQDAPWPPDRTRIGALLEAVDLR
jgi:tagatose 6-phosphate kinase